MPRGARDPRPFLEQLARQHQREQAVAETRRAAVAAYRESYKLGRLDQRTRRYVEPSHRSGTAAVMESFDRMHARTRDGQLNNPLMKRAISVLRDIIVGTGIGTFADPIDYSFGWDLQRRADADLLAALDYALEADERWEDFAHEPKLFDVAGRLDWPEMQRLALTENVQVGEAILIEVQKRRAGIPLCYQMIEQEQLDRSKDRTGGRGQTAIINGIEFDAETGWELGAWIYDAHPYDDRANGMSMFSSSFVPSWRYHRLFAQRRPSQWIGATWLHAMGQPTLDRDRYMEAELRAAIKAALITLVHKLEGAGSTPLGMTGDDEDYDEDPLGRPSIALGTDPVAAEIRPGEEVEMLNPTRPNSDAGAFFDLIDHDLAGAVDLSYYSLTGRFDRTNYGGFRGAINLENAQTIPIQNWIARQVVLPVRRRFNSLAIGLGLIDAITPSKFRAEMRRYQRFDCLAPGRHLLEPGSETDADTTELRGGLTTLKIECARRNLHWLKVLRQIALENRVCKLLGVVLDHSKGQGGQRDSTSRSADSGSTGTDDGSNNAGIFPLSI